MKIDRTIKGLLKKAGATLKNRKKHLVFAVPGGRNIVLPHKAKDNETVSTQVRELKKHLGEDAPAAPKVTRPRRSKPGRQGEARHQPPPPPNNPLAEQLRVLGITETALKQELHQAIRERDMAIQERDNLRDWSAELQQQIEACWLCRFKKWWVGKA